MINDLITSTGLGRDVITYHLDLSTLIDDFFSSAMEMGVHNIHMFGGTAINRAFFGKKQRFSIDIDVNYNGSAETGTKEITEIIKRAGYKASDGEWMNMRHTLKRLAISPASGRTANFIADVHFVREDDHTPFENLSLHSITEFFGYPPTRSVVPSYKLEYLLSGKIFALKDRTTERDIYDTYMGLALPPDYKLLKKYIEEYETFPQLVSVATHRLEKLMLEAKKISIARYIPSYCTTDLNLMASEINRMLLKML